MNLVKLTNIAKAFGGVPLFKDITFEINSREKVALIGQNGAGKTTLVKMILGDVDPDAGDVFVFSRAKIGYLAQSVIEDDNRPLIDEIMTVFKERVLLEKQLREAAKKLETDHSDAMIRRYSQIEEVFTHAGGYDYLFKTDQILSRFGFDKTEYSRIVSTFSGGEKTRIAFAKLLLIEPELLILDEPTNHMDITIIEWLEDYLKKYPGAVLCITHDKYFINKVADKIFEIDHQTLSVYYGNYDQYEVEKVARYEQMMKLFNRQSKEIAHLQSFVDRFRYKATKAKSAQDRIKKIARIERIDRPDDSKESVRFRFRTKRPTDAVVLTAKNVAIGYETPIQTNIDFEMRGNQKVGIIGPNGIGKTTFIKTVMGTLEPLEGKLRFHKEYQIGYFDQNLAYFNPDLTVIETIHGRYPTKTMLEVRTLLAQFLFEGEDVFKTVSVISGGEKVRLVLCLLMLEKPDFLILDEPTNHLDIDTKNIVEDVFDDYEGPIIFISHDRYFINKVANRIMDFSSTGVTVHDGNYEDYKVWIQAKNQEAKLKVDTTPSARSKAGDVRKLETKLEILQKASDALRQTLFNEAVYSDKAKYIETENEIARLDAEIESLLQKIVSADTE